mgnify:CR=1 FL=1
MKKANGFAALLALSSFVALADEVATVRGGPDAVVVLDAGDEWTGPMETTFAEGEPIVAAYVRPIE